LAEKTPDAILYRAAHYGLANRLRAMVGYQAIANLLDIPFHLWWSSDDSCRARFGELFESPIKVVSSPNAKVGSNVAVFEQGVWFEVVWKTFGAQFVEWPEFLQEVHRCLRSLRPIAKIQRQVDEFASSQNLGQALGIHIRHTDNIDSYDYWVAESRDFNRADISSLDGFRNLIGENIAARPVLIATDNTRVEADLKELYPRLLTYPKPYKTAGARSTPIAHAVIEMQLLGRCSEIVGTYYSSFSKFSAVWSGVPYSEVRGVQVVRSDFVDRMLIGRDTLGL